MQKDEVSLRTAAQIVNACIHANLPCFLWGKPGIGKSEIVEQIAEQLGFECNVIIASTMNPVDVRGVPDIKNGYSTFRPPEMWRTNGKKVLFFFDELNTALPTVQVAFYKIILTGKLDGIDISNSPRIAAGNRETDAAVAFQMSSALANRFVHIPVCEDTESWLKWAYSKARLRLELQELKWVAKEEPIHPFVTSYIEWKGREALCRFDPKAKRKAYATPRTWEFVSRLIHTGIEGDARFYGIAGCIGFGEAISFDAFLKLRAKLPEPEAVLEGKCEVVPEEVSAIYAFIGSISEKFIQLWNSQKKRRDELAENLFRYSFKLTEKASEEFSIVLIKNCVALLGGKATALIAKSGEFRDSYKKWVATHGPILED